MVLHKIINFFLPFFFVQISQVLNIQCWFLGLIHSVDPPFDLAHVRTPSQRPPLTTTHPTAATTMTTSRTPMKTHMVFHRFVLASSSCQTGTFTCNHCWIVVVTLPMDPKNRPHLLVSYRTTKDYLVSYPRRHCLHLLVHCYLGRMSHHLFFSTFLSLYTS